MDLRQCRLERKIGEANGNSTKSLNHTCLSSIAWEFPLHEITSMQCRLTMVSGREGTIEINDGVWCVLINDGAAHDIWKEMEDGKQEDMGDGGGHWRWNGSNHREIKNVE